MRLLRTEIEIAVPAERVWRILTDFGSYSDWNPFVTKIQGAQTVGARLMVKIEPPGGRAMTFRPTVLRVDAPRELRWMGRLGLPGVFDGEHSFRIERLDSNRVRFVQEETFRGLLVPLIWPFKEGSTRRGFKAMNLALRKRAELTHAAGV